MSEQNFMQRFSNDGHRTCRLRTQQANNRTGLNRSHSVKTKQQFFSRSYLSWNTATLSASSSSTSATSSNAIIKPTWQHVTPGELPPTALARINGIQIDDEDDFKNRQYLWNPTHRKLSYIGRRYSTLGLDGDDADDDDDVNAVTDPTQLLLKPIAVVRGIQSDVVNTTYNQCESISVTNIKTCDFLALNKADFDNNIRSFDLAYRVVLVGDSGTGKTCFFLRFMEPTRCEYFFSVFATTVGVDVRNKVVIVDGTRVKLQIWDTAGQERFRSVTHAYYRDAHALLLLYDVTNKTTFDNIRAWLGEIRDYAQDDVVICLIGNKADCSNSDRQVKREDGERLSREHNVPFMETSAKTGQNVELAFAAIARQLKSRGSGNGDADRFNVHDFVRDNTKAQSACMQCKYQ